MWIFTTKGFISAVAWRGCDKTLCVRARVLEHLHALFPGYEVLTLQDADYRHRIRVDRRVFELAMQREARAIEYTDFKGSIPDHAYHDACVDVWTAMRGLQAPRVRAFRQRKLPWPPEPREGEPDEQLPW